MKLRRFSAPTASDALRQVKAELGPDAVILERAEAGGQVTVTAAVDVDVLPAAGGELAEEVRQLVDLVHELVDEHWRAHAPDLEPPLRALRRTLLAQGVDGVIAAALVRETADQLQHGGSLALAVAGIFGAPRPPARVRLFIGPPGDGKTTTIAKLAALEQRTGRHVALVTADTYRVGGAAELEVYGRALGLPVARVTEPGDLGHVLDGLGAADCILVDTPGAGPTERAELAEVTALAAAAGRAAGRTLVASAAAGSRAAAEMWRAFTPLAPDACILTKVDLAPGGPMLGVLWQRRVPVSHVAMGRRIPDDIEQATPDRLARCLLAA